MAKKIQLKNTKTKDSVADFIKGIEDKELRSDCQTLLKLFRETTGSQAKMWGSSMIGFGEYVYHRSNGDEGCYLATGFSPRKSGPTIYIMPGYSDHSKLLSKLGPHKVGKSCLYLKSLEKIDLGVLKKLIKVGLRELAENHVVRS